jgi:arylsulfatase A-like enzyme
MKLVAPFILVLLLCASFALSTTAEAPAQELITDASPNIVLIIIDALRADHLSSYGYHLKTSPRIDQLAGEGVRFENSYCTIPLTGPSVTSIFTSRYPQESGARINGVAVPVQSKWLFLPQILQQFRYTNAAFVSGWPLNSRLTKWDRFFHHYDENLTRNYQLFSSSRWAEDVTPPAIEWLKENNKRPFFLFVHYFDPHEPYHLREEFASPPDSGNAGAAAQWRDPEIRERSRNYDSEIGYADYHIGKVLDKIDELGLRDSTLVVLTADHGESLGQHGYVGHGRHLYDGIVRVPLIMRYPAKIPAGKVITQRVTSLDITPTVLDLSIHPDDSERPPSLFAGMSLARAIQGNEPIPERPIRYVTFAGKKGYAPKWLSWMWVRYDRLPLRLGRTQGSEKLVWTPQDASLEVFDLAEDALELDPNVVDKESETYRRHTASLTKWYKTTDLDPGDSRLTKRDVEILRSLGYVQ